VYLTDLLRKGFSEARTEPALDWLSLELGAYEALCLRPGATFKTLAEWIGTAPSERPSELVEEDEAIRCARMVRRHFVQTGAHDVGLRLRGTPDYPARLLDARHPLRAFYFRGDWSLTGTPTVAVVGARQLTQEGRARTRRLVQRLVEDGFTIVSGLAAGTDTVAHATALEMGGKTIAVLGTPIHKTYPRENMALQQRLAESFLVISQVPVLLYDAKDWRYNRKFFPERNITLCALTDASIIVEIGDSNGTFIQSKAALDQGRPLFLLNNCFKKSSVSWPAQFEKRGAVRVREYEDIRSRIGHTLAAARQPEA
jgi:DNA processing protein